LGEAAPPAQSMTEVQSTVEIETLDALIAQRGGVEDIFAALLSHPLLPEATRVFATSMHEAARTDAVLDAIFKDTGRYLVAMSAVYLHVKGGATLSRLKAMLSVRSYVSAGRLHALLQFLCHLGCLTEVPPHRREPVLYLPTDRFMTAWRHHMRKMLEATRIVEPSVARVLDRLDEVDVFAAFCRNQGEYALGEIRESHPDLAFTRIFLHRFAGHQIFWQLLAVQGAGEAPLQGALPVSVDDIAKLHGVSRVHVRHLLDDGVKEGLLRYGDNNDIVLEGTGRAMARYNQAQQFFVLIAAADKTVREFA